MPAKLAAQITSTVAHLEQAIGDLDHHIAAEEARTGKTDPAHFAYPSMAQAMRLRRANLHLTLATLTARFEQLAAAAAA